MHERCSLNALGCVLHPVSLPTLLGPCSGCVLHPQRPPFCSLGTPIPNGLVGLSHWPCEGAPLGMEGAPAVCGQSLPFWGWLHGYHLLREVGPGPHPERGSRLPHLPLFEEGRCSAGWRCLQAGSGPTRLSPGSTLSPMTPCNGSPGELPGCRAALSQGRAGTGCGHCCSLPCPEHQGLLSSGCSGPVWIFCLC